MNRTTLILVTLALLLSSMEHAKADMITIGNPSPLQANVAPFGEASYSGHSYQEVYSASAFSGPVQITDIAFGTFSNNGGNPKVTSSVLNVTLSLSSTSASPNTLVAGYPPNRGADYTQVFSGTQLFTPSYNGSFDLVFAITPFTYNPGNGNLLIEVDVNSIVNVPTNAFSGFLFDPNNSKLGRVFELNGGSGATAVGSDQGLVTQFTVNPGASATPEPSSLTLIGIGAIGILGYAWRQRKRAVAGTY